MKLSLRTTLPAVALLGVASSALAYQPPVTPTLDKCVGQLSMILDEKATELHKLANAKGHRVISEEDLKYSAKKLQRGDFVFALTLSQYNAWFGEQAEKLVLPTTLETYSAQMLDQETEDSAQVPLIHREKLEEGMARLAALDQKRGEGKLTKDEASMTLESLFRDLFLSDAELAKTKVKIVALFEPRMAIPYHPTEFALEDGYGQRGKNNSLIVGIEIDGLEYKRRVLAQTEFGKKTLAELSENHVMSEAGIYAMSLANALSGQLLTEADFAKLEAQALSLLPSCR